MLGGPTLKLKKAGGGLGGRAQRLPPNALVAGNALQMSIWRSFVVVVVVVAVVVVVVVLMLLLVVVVVVLVRAGGPTVK